MLKKQGYRDQLIKHQEQLAQQTKKMTDEMGMLLQNPNLNLDLAHDTQDLVGINSQLMSSITKSGDLTKENTDSNKPGIAIQTLNVNGNVQIQHNDRLI